MFLFGILTFLIFFGALSFSYLDYNSNRNRRMKRNSNWWKMYINSYCATATRSLVSVFAFFQCLAWTNEFWMVVLVMFRKIMLSFNVTLLRQIPLCFVAVSLRFSSICRHSAAVSSHICVQFNLRHTI